MALKGTLKDFGIADILQLIGQQRKTGVLYLKGKSGEVEVSFVDGEVARALSRKRRSRELLGEMLVRGGLLDEAGLAAALETQKRTLKRLGDILVAEGRLSAEQLREATQLQTAETLYQLFVWKQGTYEFVQQDVEQDPAQGAPLRSEGALLEGFRRLDEWPLVRKRVPSLGLVFETLLPLEPPRPRPGAQGEEVDVALDAALAQEGAPARVPRHFGPNEHLVYRLAAEGHSARRLCELSMLGEFETCKALSQLIEAGYLRALPPGRRVREAPPSAAADGPELGRVLRQGAVQTAFGLLLVVLLALGARASGGPRPTSASVVPAESSAPRQAAAWNQMSRLESALELYRLAHGRYPDTLRALVAERLVAPDELRRPFSSDFHYRPDGDLYVLLPPLE